MLFQLDMLSKAKKPTQFLDYLSDLRRFTDKSVACESRAKKKPLKDYSGLTTYSIKLIKFYNFFVRIMERFILNFLFFYAIFMLLFKLPYYFFTSFIGSSITYAESEIESEKPGLIIKTKKKLSDRTILNTLARKSLKKGFIEKYFYADTNLENCEMNKQSMTLKSTDFFADLDAKAAKRERLHRKNSMINIIDLPIITAQNICQKSFFSPGTTKIILIISILLY